MNIKEAKEEIKNAVRAYLEKDEAGQYEIPVERQRPVLLMGPPGIGKTAIMEQIAHELGIGLVAYTITHHTRQSAIGLPMISEKEYGGKNYSVTEYTMSEIIGAVYDKIEQTGVHEGILFLDEINCVSETLAPTMLQFLQYKTFGSHKVPDGFIIVTAGNPARYNRSVRDFDIVTLDRVRKISIEEDYEAWKEYAYKEGVHGAIMAYLEIKKDNFYSIKSDVDGKSFVTARGWEDLSRVIKVHEKLGIPVDNKLTDQYLQNKEIARDFADYYELYHRYNELYKIPDILEGNFPSDLDSVRKAAFDEKLSIIGLLTDKLMGEFREYSVRAAVQKHIFSVLKEFIAGAGDGGSSVNSAVDKLVGMIDAFEKETLRQAEADLIDRDEERARKIAGVQLRECAKKVKGDASKDAVASVREWFNALEGDRQNAIKVTGNHLTNSFEFMEKAFGNPESLTGSQEMVIFLTELSSAYHSLKFVRETGNDVYYKYNKLLLLGDRKQELTREVMELL
ncbi:MAG: AAA family ATPase [Butyrivibrio sp.]|nr:AAA family ATPase [Butyrivibrio sp.]